MYTHSYDGQDSHLCNKANNMSFTLYVNQGLLSVLYKTHFAFNTFYLKFTLDIKRSEWRCQGDDIWNWWEIGFLCKISTKLIIF